MDCHFFILEVDSQEVMDSIFHPATENFDMKLPGMSELVTGTGY